MKHKIIDSHQHFWEYHPTKHGWISDEMNIIRKDFDGEMSAELMDSLGVSGVVAVQADQSEEETQYLLQLAGMYPHIQGVVGWVDLQSENVSERLKHYSQYDKLKGFRHVVQDEKDPSFMLRQPFLKGIATLFEYGYTYDILIFPHQLPMAIEFVKRFPDQPLVLDHLAKPDIKLQKQHPWKEQMAELASFRNVFVKLSGLVTEAHWMQWQTDDFMPFIETALEYFGPKRCMFGSDYPVCTLSASYPQVLNIVENAVAKLSEDDQKRIWSESAIDFYQL